MNDIATEVASKFESYLAVNLFLFILFFVISSICYYLYRSYKKGEIWDSDGSDTGSSSWKIRRDEDPRGFWQAWWTNLAIMIGIIVLILVIMFL